MPEQKITINGETYVLESSIQTEERFVAPAKEYFGMKYCVIRTYSAGVHIGYLKRHEGQEVELVNSRRLWRWEGAASLSQVAVDGVSNESKFCVVIPHLILTDVIEIIQCSEKAQTILQGLKEWKE